MVAIAKHKKLMVDLEPMISMKWLKPSQKEKRRARLRGDGKQKMPKKLVCNNSSKKINLKCIGTPPCFSSILQRLPDLHVGQNLSKWRSTLKGKNLLLKEQILSFES